MPERSKDWIRQAERDLSLAEDLMADEDFECESGSPYEYFRRRDAEDAIVYSRRIIKFCNGILA